MPSSATVLPTATPATGKESVISIRHGAAVISGTEASTRPSEFPEGAGYVPLIRGLDESCRRRQVTSTFKMQPTGVLPTDDKVVNFVEECAAAKLCRESVIYVRRSVVLPSCLQGCLNSPGIPAVFVCNDDPASVSLS